MKRPRGSGSIFVMSGPFEQRSQHDVLWIRYCQNGKVFRESTGSTKIRDAEKLLKSRLADVEKNTFFQPADRRLLVDDLYADLVAEYQNNGMASLEGCQQRWEYKGNPGRLKDFFGGVRAVSVDKTMLNRYVAECREQGLSNGTINRDLAALRRAMYLAVEAETLAKVPKFPHLKESEARSGFVEETQYRKLAEHAKELWLRALLATAYTFGFRKGELLNLQVRQVDLANRTIRLNAGETKSGDGRVIVMTQDVLTLLQACCAGKDADSFVFTRHNKRVRDFRETWNQLCISAGCTGLLFHDLRRSAVRNMVRRGVIQKVAMDISGHKTISVFQRYNIVSEDDLADAARKIEAGQTAVLAEFWQNRKEASTTKQVAVRPN
jgi:integrase